MNECVVQVSAAALSLYVCTQLGVESASGLWEIMIK